ncbi:cytochrome C oxidase subunit II [Paenibacillus sp. sgz500992]|uniref:cytochrome C oxidase subunit II n=1 Tax=Paenibacillus sp. sgz500992 TaxID=3242476 RepID=UPI0036D404AC
MIRRSAMLLSIAFVLILSACSGGNGKQAGSTSNNGTAASGIKPEDELIISATNYSFDQEEYHLKKGVPVEITFKNESGNHGILVPELELQLTAKDSSRVIVPEEAGTFEMTCAIMCGSGHSSMSAKIIVE